MSSAPTGLTRPSTIRWFEAAFVSAMVLYPPIILAGRDPAIPFEVSMHGVMLGAMIVAQIVAMVLVARRRRTWARWVICALLVLDVPMYMALLPASAFESQAFLGLSLVQFGLHCAAVFLLFTPSTSTWLRGTERS